MGALRPSAATLVLRDVRREDLPIFYEQQLDPEALRMADFPSREEPEFQAHWSKILADPGLVKQTIVWNGEVAGNIVCFPQAGRTLVGYWLGRLYWGRGVATRALRAFLEQVASRPLHALVAPHNHGSIRVLEKCGFRPCDPGPRREEDLEELCYVLVDRGVAQGG